MKHRGFTVLEVIFALTIAVIIVGILVAFIMQSRAIYQAADISASLQANSRQAIERIALDLKRTNRTRIIITQNTPLAGTDMIQYQLPQYDVNSLPVSVGSAISWDVASSIALNNTTQQLLQTQGGNTRVLASNVNSVQFFDHARPE